jgi:hypothetical protein
MIFTLKSRAVAAIPKHMAHLGWIPHVACTGQGGLSLKSRQFIVNRDQLFPGGEGKGIKAGAATPYREFYGVTGAANVQSLKIRCVAFVYSSTNKAF